MTVLILILVAGCSFHSAQWESAKALWAMRAPATQPGQETYWWDMEHEGQTYRLFPVAWNGKTVLTDAKRWMIVLQNSEITMIRDFQKNQQITFEDSVDPLVGAREMDGDSDSSRRYLDSSYLALGLRSRLLRVPLVSLWKLLKPQIFCAPIAIRFPSVAFDNKMYFRRTRDRFADGRV